MLASWRRFGSGGTRSCSDPASVPSSIQRCTTSIGRDRSAIYPCLALSECVLDVLRTCIHGIVQAFRVVDVKRERSEVGARGAGAIGPLIICSLAGWLVGQKIDLLIRRLAGTCWLTEPCRHGAGSEYSPTCCTSKEAHVQPRNAAQSCCLEIAWLQQEANDSGTNYLLTSTTVRSLRQDAVTDKSRQHSTGITLVPRIELMC